MHSFALGLSRLAPFNRLLSPVRASPRASAHRIFRSSTADGPTLQGRVDRSLDRFRTCRNRPSVRCLSVLPMATPAGQLAQLIGEADRYDGVILDADHLPSDPAEFSERLAHSLKVPSRGENAGCITYLLGDIL